MLAFGRRSDTAPDGYVGPGWPRFDDRSSDTRGWPCPIDHCFDPRIALINIHCRIRTQSSHAGIAEKSDNNCTLLYCSADVLYLARHITPRTSFDHPSCPRWKLQRMVNSYGQSFDPWNVSMGETLSATAVEWPYIQVDT